MTIQTISEYTAHQVLLKGNPHPTLQGNNKISHGNDRRTTKIKRNSRDLNLSWSKTQVENVERTNPKAVTEGAE
jgi:hypothetical protein